MKIRVISDLHVDVNHNYPFSLDKDEIFTIICGDTSGFINKTRKWVKDNVSSGLFIIGNHYGYNDDMIPYQTMCARLKRSFPLSGSVSFLQNSYKIVDDVVFVGATLWTDYMLDASNEDERNISMMIARRSMNDFRFCLYVGSDGIERQITPTDCVYEHNKSLDYLGKICDRFKSKRIVVVTHHAPSRQSISNKYRSSDVNGAYASDLSGFILDHPNIKLWCHGHVHEDKDYMIGNTRVVCNPRGYELWDAPHKFDKNLIVEI